MTTIDATSLEQVLGGGLFPKQVVKTIGELYMNRKDIPYAYWTTWGHKQHGMAAPPLGHPDGVRYGFWGRPLDPATIVLEGPLY